MCKTLFYVNHIKCVEFKYLLDTDACREGVDCNGWSSSTPSCGAECSSTLPWRRGRVASHSFSLLRDAAT